MVGLINKIKIVINKEELQALDQDTTDFILNILRRGTSKWAGRNLCLNRGRRLRIIGTKKNGDPKGLWERDCDECKQWFLLKDNSLEVDHIDEVGPYKGNIHTYCERLFCGQENLQALCFSCHTRKTSKFNASLRFIRKVKPE